ASDFPDIAISEKANSLVRAHLDSTTHGRFAELDQQDYAAVVGNPPYVRAERSGQLDSDTVQYFESTRMAPGGGRSPVAASVVRAQAKERQDADQSEKGA
ncbi:MAG: hypothetical protein IH998_02595, partial [Proteobacteria bacterium]|nr:hypothetical protein [Pseudomonadota bacterium]